MPDAHSAFSLEGEQRRAQSYNAERAVIAVVSNMQYIILSIVVLYISQQSRYSVFNGPTPTGYSK